MPAITPPDVAQWVATERGILFEGYAGECGEHRTVGDHRAWCFECTEWCYAPPATGEEPAACKGCAHKYGWSWP